jgi:hypothetical protein
LWREEESLQEPKNKRAKILRAMWRVFNGFKCPFGLATVCLNPAYVNRERILVSHIMWTRKMWLEEDSCRAKEQRPRSLMPCGALQWLYVSRQVPTVCPNPGHVKRERILGSHKMWMRKMCREEESLHKPKN